MKKVAEIALVLFLTITIAWFIVGFVLWDWRMGTWHPVIRGTMIFIAFILLAPWKKPKL